MTEAHCSACGKRHAERAVNECRHNLAVALGQEVRIASDYQQQRDEWRTQAAGFAKHIEALIAVCGENGIDDARIMAAVHALPEKYP